MTHEGRPTVILAKTKKGYGMGGAGEYCVHADTNRRPESGPQAGQRGTFLQQVLGVELVEQQARPEPPGGQGVAGRDDSGLGRTADVLALHGYEPRTSDGEICLANCPFDRLATEHTELVCGMNLALIDGVIDGLGVSAVSAELAPQPGFCCVKVTERSASS